MIVTLLSGRDVDQVRRDLPGRGGRFTFRGASKLVEATGEMRADGDGTRLVANGRLLPAIALPASFLVALFVFVSFSEPILFLVLLVGAIGAALLAPRMLARYRADKEAVLAALVTELDATVLPPRERGVPKPKRKR